jgi:DNA-binding NarL/FixJ family response regulator
MTAAGRSPSPPSADPLVERDRELAQLHALAAGAAHGDAALALIEGSAGIGKSRLLAELRAGATTTVRTGAAAGMDAPGERAADTSATAAHPTGMLVCSARASELERELPFGIVRQLFEPLLRGDGAARWLAGAAAGAEPVLTAIAEPAAGEEPAGDSSFAVLHGLHWLVVNLTAERPLLLAIDDLHWCDRPSLRFLAYLARRLEGMPVLVATTARVSEPGTDAALLAELAHDPLAVVVRPGPLSADGVRALARGRLGEQAEAAFCDACAEVTGGNPLLLRQLLSALAADGVAPTAANALLVQDVGPRAVSRTVLLGLARLSPAATAVARAVAILGESAESHLLAALAQLDEAAVDAAAAELVRAEILLPQQPLAFVHPLVRDAVHGELPAAERQRQHARAAALLHERGLPAEQVAQQLLAAPARGEAWVVAALRAAGRSAMRKGAPESAVAYLQRALAEPPPEAERAQVLFELGGTEALTSGPAAVEHLRAAYEQTRDPVARGQIAVLHARTLLFTGSARGAGVLAEEAAAALGSEQADLRQALAAIAAVAYSSGAGDFERAARALAPYRAAREGDGPGAKTAATMWAFVGTVTGAIGAEEAVALAQEALADGDMVPFDAGHVSVSAPFALALADRDEALPALASIRDFAHRRGSLFAAMGAGLWGGWLLLHRGDLVEAERELRGCLDLQAVWGEAGIGHAYARAFLAETLIERGDLTGAATVLGGVAVGVADAEGDAFVQRSRVLLLLNEGRGEDALDAVAGYGRRDAALHPAWEPWRSLQARALDLAGRTADALALVDEELGTARRWGAPGIVGATLRLRGALAREQGERDLREAVALLAASTRRLEQAKALAALGGLLRRSRRVEEAREPLREALALAGACGADGLAAEVRAELQASGVRPRREALSGPAALTASERRVAERAADGQSNREIAQALYVTPKTVEVHLTNAYRKLGIRSRRELGAALAEPAADAPAGTP